MFFEFFGEAAHAACWPVVDNFHNIYWLEC